MPKYKGSCHCGAIKFEIDADITELTTCDCSICTKKNAIMTKVHESNFTLVSNRNSLSEYRWNMKVARHYFCSTCGIYTFHRKRAQPDCYGINIFCIDDFDPSETDILKTEGENMTVVASEAREEWPGPRLA